jgi:hypothetical protein
MEVTETRAAPEQWRSLLHYICTACQSIVLCPSTLKMEEAYLLSDCVVSIVVVFLFPFFLAPLSSSELYTSLSSSPVRKVPAYWYINLYGLLTYTLAFISHVHKFVLCSGCLQYGPVF